MISPTIAVEDLVAKHPRAVAYLVERKLPCLVCGEPVWGSLAELLRDKGFTDDEIEDFVGTMSHSLEIKSRTP